MRYITEIDALTGEAVERPMTDEENAQADRDEKYADLLASGWLPDGEQNDI